MTEHHGSASAAAQLDRIAAVIRSRAQHHGDAVAQHAALAALITPYLRKRLGADVTLTASDAAYICLLLKISRIEAGGMQMQHAEDLAGYAGIVMACLNAEMGDAAVAATKADVPRVETPDHLDAFRTALTRAGAVDPTQPRPQAIYGNPSAAAEQAFDPGEGAEDAPPSLCVRNVNHRGEEHVRCILPTSVWFGVSKYHRGPQWILTAFDVTRGVTREFALAGCDFLSAGGAPVEDDGVKMEEGGVYVDRCGITHGTMGDPRLHKRGAVYWSPSREQFETGVHDSTGALVGWTKNGRATNGNSKRDLVTRVK